MGQGSKAQKVPFARSLDQNAAKKVVDGLQVLGKELPCSIVSVLGWIVTVKIELDTDFTLSQLTVPVFNSAYDYIPFQAGDKGVLMSIDTYLGGMSGLGGGVASLDVLPNLTAVGFVPVGRNDFTAPVDANKRQIQGPNGVVAQDTQGRCVWTLSPSGIIVSC
jgi:hypothetical protein